MYQCRVHPVGICIQKTKSADYITTGIPSKELGTGVSTFQKSSKLVCDGYSVSISYTSVKQAEDGKRANIT